MRYHVVEQITSFNDIECIETEVLAEALHYIENSLLEWAMSTAPQTCRAAILAALTESGGALLMENMALLGPVPRSQVEAAQAQFVAVVNLVLRTQSLALNRKLVA